MDATRAVLGDLLIEGNKIARVASLIEPSNLPDDVQRIDARGLLVFPGFIDAHTHYHLISRNTVTADGFVEGSKLAAFGGVTTIIDFADHQKGRSLAASAVQRSLAMSSEMAIDWALHQGVYRLGDELEEELTAVAHMGIRIIKLFTTYKEIGYMLSYDQIKKVLLVCKKLCLLPCIHCEDNQVIEKCAQTHPVFSKAVDHIQLRPSEAEALAIKKVGELALELDVPVYIVHLSSLQGLEEVRWLRKQGASIGVETTPHYLYLDQSLLASENGALHIMTPPLRTAEDGQALRKALVEGEIDVVATDHCAFAKEQKLQSMGYPGIPGTEEMLSLVYTHEVATKRISVTHLVRLLATNPARLFGLWPRKGSLKAGSDADVVLFDPQEKWTLSSSTLHSSSGYSSYEGMKVTGKVVMTIAQGVPIVKNGDWCGTKGSGHFIPSSASSLYT